MGAASDSIGQAFGSKLAVVALAGLAGQKLQALAQEPAVVLGREDLDSKLRELARLLAADVPEIGDAAEIDLRFADQAVLRKESPPEEAAKAAAARGRATPSI